MSKRNLHLKAACLRPCATATTNLAVSTTVYLILTGAHGMQHRCKRADGLVREEEKKEAREGEVTETRKRKGKKRESCE